MTTRRICFTLNNPTEESERALQQEKRFSYLIYGREIGESGTPHLQGYAEFYKPTKYGALAKLHKMHCEVTKGTQAEAILYCKKDGDVYEQGEKKEEDGGKKEQKRGEDARQAASEGRFEDIPSDIYMRYYGNIHKIAIDHMPKPLDLDTLENEWIYGPTGTGKSYGVRKAYPGLYSHSNTTKWWDGYQGEDVVLIDDLGKKTFEWLGEYIKIWADHYSFIADFKGKSRCIRPKKIIITSNYKIEDMTDDINIIEPLKRRFKVIHQLGYIGVINPITNEQV